MKCREEKTIWSAMGLANWTLYWAFGPGFGMLIGIVIGSIMDLNKDKK